MTLRLGVIGLSPGNGHPFSWSAIFNGYDPKAMVNCGFPVIPEYLGRQEWPADQLTGARVTHVWTQDAEISKRVSKAALIENVVDKPELMVGEIDALLLARDDAEHHSRFAAPFLRAGLPVYIDKPIALSESKFVDLLRLQLRPGQIFSCSALRFAPELQLTESTAARIGRIRHIEGVTPKSWETYGIHLIDPLLAILGHDIRPEHIFTRVVGDAGRLVVLRWPEGGPDVHLMATGNSPSPLHLRVVGEGGEAHLVFKDSFTAFKRALSEFVGSVLEGKSRLSDDFNRRAVQIVEMGLG